MSLEQISDDIIRCTKCREEMDIRLAVHTTDDWWLTRAKLDGLVCPFCSGKEIERLRKALVELVYLMDDTVSGRYKPDSFTTQPARSTLGYGYDGSGE